MQCQDKIKSLVGNLTGIRKHKIEVVGKNWGKPSFNNEQKMANDDAIKKKLLE